MKRLKKKAKRKVLGRPPEGDLPRTAQMQLIQKQHHARLRFYMLQHYSQAAVPKCRNCGETDISKLKLHHVNNTGVALMKEAGIGRGNYNAYWKWLIEHKFPVKHDQAILCAVCHAIFHRIFYRGETKVTKDMIDKVAHAPVRRSHPFEASRRERRLPRSRKRGI